MTDTPPPQPPALPSPGMSPQQATRGAAAREHLRQRVGRYKRRIAVAAIVGFGVISFLIANPDLSGIVSAASSSSNQQDPGNNFNQQGGNFNGNGTSQQPPSTGSHTS